MFQSDRIMILAPHTDDGELGCGGSIAKYTGRGKEVIYIAFSTCTQSLPEGWAPDTLEKECRYATSILGIRDSNRILLSYEVRQFSQKRQNILDDLLRIKKEFQPQTIFLPAQADIHQDHHVIYAEGMRAFKDCNLLGYELPWNNLRFQPNYFEKLTKEELSKKVEALNSYKSQQHRSYMKEDFIRSLAVVRGVQAQAPLAESFEIYRLAN